MTTKNLEDLILDILKAHKGKENAITVQGLCSQTLASPRMVRKAIANLVNSRLAPIASSVHFPYGFYLIENKDEAEACLRQYYSRVKEVSRRARSLKEAVKQKFGIDYQEEFDYVKDRKPPA